METALSFIVLLSLCPRPDTVIKSLQWLASGTRALFHFILPEENLCASCNMPVRTPVDENVSHSFIHKLIKVR